MTTLVTSSDLTGGVVLLELNDPKSRNALSAEMRAALVLALESLLGDPEVSAIVLKGSGGNFCSGGDIRTMGDQDPAAIEERMQSVADTAMAIASSRKPLVVFIQGHAAGAGVGLALLADQIVADQNAVLTLSFRKLALGPDWGLSQTLPARVGAARARQWLMAGASIAAEDAVRDGLVDVVATGKEGLDHAVTLARGLGARPYSVELSIKLQMSDLNDLKIALEKEKQLQIQRMMSAEHRAAVEQFRSAREKKR